MTDKDPPGVAIPSKFWKTMKPGEFAQIALNDGILNAEQCARLWRMEDRNTEPPQSLEVLINRADLERLLKQEKRKRKGVRHEPKSD